MFVCVWAIASQRNGIPESTTRVCVVPGLRFPGGAGNNKPARHLFGPLLPKEGGICAGARTSKTNTRRIYPGHCFGAGVGENRNPRSICQGIGGAGRGSLEYLHQYMKQRVFDCRARLFLKSIFIAVCMHISSQWNSSKGAWCSGITSASHAEGPGFNPQCVQLSCVQLSCDGCDIGGYTDHTKPQRSHTCISRESNPGHIDGNDVFYHWTTDAMFSFEAVTMTVVHTYGNTAYTTHTRTENRTYQIGLARSIPEDDIAEQTRTTSP